MSKLDEVFLSQCDCLSIAMLMNAVSGQGLWLLTSAIHRLGVAKVCKELRARDFGPPNRMTKAKIGATCPFCTAPNILKVRENTLTEFEGLCLDCVKNHFKTEEQRIMCRGPHRKYRGLPSQQSPAET